MKKLFLEPKDTLPGILFERESGKLRIYGKSCPDNPFEFYAPIFKWIDSYLENPSKKTVLEFYLSYFNTASAKIILNIMKKMENLSKSGKKVTVKWVYNENDENLLEAGEDYEKIVDIKFEFTAIQNKEDELNEEDRIDNLIDSIL